MSDGSAHEQRPLAGYSTLTAIFTAAIAGSLVAAWRRNGAPARLGAWDVVTVGLATHKLSRLITKDRVTSFIRAPFVRHVDGAGHGEVDEQPRGDGLQLAIGELL